MARLISMLLVSTVLGLTGCQKAKMAKSERRAAPRSQGPSAYPPPQHYPPPQQNYPPRELPPPLPMPEDEPMYSSPPSADDYEGELNPEPQQGQRPRLDEENITEYVDKSKIPRLLDTCVNGCAPAEPPPVEDCRENSTCKEPDPSPGNCDSIHIDGKAKAQKLDVLFVIDTSLSMRKKKASGTSEVEDMAAQMDKFVSKLDPETDYNIGVLLAHGPATNKHPNNLHGQLFKGGNEKVISFARELKKNGSRKAATKSVVRLLKQKMSAIDKKTNDRSDAQGEVGLMSLYSAVTNQHLKRDIISEGLFREDAALNVIFVSDENDVCYDYAANGRSIGAPDKAGKEEKTLNGICATAMSGQRLTEDGVLTALRNLKGTMPLIVSAIVYTNKGTVPPVKANDENEMGWGYIDIVKRAHGDSDAPLADLAGRNYEKSLSQLGAFAQTTMTFPDFICETDVDADNINYTSLKIQISSGKGLLGKFCIKGSKNCGKGAKKLHAQVTNGKYVLSVDSAELEKMMARTGEEGATANITFKKLKEDGKGLRAQQVHQLRSQSDDVVAAKKDKRTLLDLIKTSSEKR